MASTCLEGGRNRKVIRRSRFGCRNCKLRKLKCDEGKPGCKKCGSFGLVCNFMPGVPDLQPIADDLVRLSVDRRNAEPQPPLAGNVWTSDTSTFSLLDAKCQDFVTRYLGRSLITPDDPSMVEVNRKLLRLAFTYPFLMHASLAVAFAYDRYLNSSFRSHRTLEECYHWSQSTVMFNIRLREPIETKDKDAIWGTAAALAMLSFSLPDACTAEESWPLKSSAPFDLEWLCMINGKMSLWRIVNPLRPDSLFRIMAPTIAHMHTPFTSKGVDGMPRDLAIVCRLEESSTAESNPYFNAAHALTHIQCLSDEQVTTDPVALLILYLWYRKAGRSIWWIALRARVECPAICSYLRLYHKESESIHVFLPGGLIADDWN
ncbi:hypothetical protein F5Y01DRAFT_329525 [Xylaria sp. FL0043]|nr:hypothetical protein F5Y01DRAFT_329525 [Xylaria sp. FL0043]